MKHLKKYNESIEQKSLQDIKDILLELEDEGFITRIATRRGIATITITNHNVTYFKYPDVKETMLRLKDYLGSNYRGTSCGGSTEYMYPVPIDVKYNIHGKMKFIHVLFATYDIIGMVEDIT